MPECRRCRRVFATCEFRRTSLGFVCRENGPGSRCGVLERERILAERRASHELVERDRGAPTDSQSAAWRHARGGCGSPSGLEQTYADGDAAACVGVVAARAARRRRPRG